jgi:hypothetical protein
MPRPVHPASQHMATCCPESGRTSTDDFHTCGIEVITTKGNAMPVKTKATATELSALSATALRSMLSALEAATAEGTSGATAHALTDARFRVSAQAYATAILGGVAASTLADDIKASTKDMIAPDGIPFYTSPESVGYHARTGRLLMLPVGADDAHTPADAIKVQGLIKSTQNALGKAGGGAPAVDKVIKTAKTQGAAVERLTALLKDARKAKADAKAAKLAADAETAEGAEGASLVPTTLVELLAAAAIKLRYLIASGDRITPDVSRALADCIGAAREVKAASKAADIKAEGLRVTQGEAA